MFDSCLEVVFFFEFFELLVMSLGKDPTLLEQS